MSGTCKSYIVSIDEIIQISPPKTFWDTAHLIVMNFISLAKYRLAGAVISACIEDGLNEILATIQDGNKMG